MNKKKFEYYFYQLRRQNNINILPSLDLLYLKLVRVLCSDALQAGGYCGGSRSTAALWLAVGGPLHLAELATWQMSHPSRASVGISEIRVNRAKQPSTALVVSASWLKSAVRSQQRGEEMIHQPCELCAIRQQELARLRREGAKGAGKAWDELLLQMLLPMRRS